MIRAVLLCSMLILFSVMILSFPVEQIKLSSYQGSSYQGSYNGGLIKIYGFRHDGFENYLFTAIHEWGHHVYGMQLNRSARLEWDGLIDEAGLESGYPFETSGTSASDEEEEFCQCAAYFWMGMYGECSADKMFFIVEVWK